jgi:hypothetical protein
MALVVDLLFFEPGAAVQQHLLVQPESTVADSVDRITQVSLTALWQLDPSDRMENTFLTFIFTFFPIDSWLLFDGDGPLFCVCVCLCQWNKWRGWHKQRKRRKGPKVNGLSMNTSKAANWIRSRRLGFQMRLI